MRNHRQDHKRSVESLRFSGSSVLFLATLIISIALLSCTRANYTVSPSQSYIKEIPDHYIAGEEQGGISKTQRWWQSFDDDHLNALVDAALDNNFTLKQYFARIKQSQAIAKQREAQLYPEISGELTGDRFYFNDREDTNTAAALLRTSWEIDLWDRLSSAARAANLEVFASREDLESASLQLCGEIASTYFGIIEQNGQLKLALDQLSTNQRILDILQSRFALGGSTLLDIYQQREQLIATRANLPRISASITQLQYRLSVLLGRVPEKQIFTSIDALPELSPTPHTGVPSELLFNRPDLRAIINRVHAAGFQIDRARADRLPQIIIGGSTGFRGGGLTTDDLFLSLFAELITPIVDWGEREAEVLRTQAVYEELSAQLNQAFIKSVEEVQTALWNEMELHKLLRVKQEQLKVAQAALKESQLRYLQGIIDYLPSLTALFSSQQLERDIISLQSELVQTRITLFQAIGSANYLIDTQL